MHSTTYCSVRTGANMFASDLEFKTFSKEGWDVIRGSRWWELCVILFRPVPWGELWWNNAFSSIPWPPLQILSLNMSDVRMNPFEGGSVPDIFNGIKFHVKRGISSCMLQQECNAMYLSPTGSSVSAPQQQDIAISENWYFLNGPSSKMKSLYY